MFLALARVGRAETAYGNGAASFAVCCVPAIALIYGIALARPPIPGSVCTKY
jgi:hypothetical protein